MLTVTVHTFKKVCTVGGYRKWRFFALVVMDLRLFDFECVGKRFPIVGKLKESVFKHFFGVFWLTLSPFYIRKALKHSIFGPLMA